MLYCSAIKIYLFYSRTRIIVHVILLCYSYTIVHEQLSTCSRQFLKESVLQNGIRVDYYNPSYDNYSIRVYQSFTIYDFPLIAIYIFTLPYHAGIMCNAFNDPLY